MACNPHVPKYPPISTKPCSNSSDGGDGGGDRDSDGCSPTANVSSCRVATVVDVCSSPPVDVGGCTPASVMMIVAFTLFGCWPPCCRRCCDRCCCCCASSINCCFIRFRFFSLRLQRVIPTKEAVGAAAAMPGGNGYSRSPNASTDFTCAHSDHTSSAFQNTTLHLIASGTLDQLMQMSAARIVFI